MDWHSDQPFSGHLPCLPSCNISPEECSPWGHHTALHLYSTKGISFKENIKALRNNHEKHFSEHHSSYYLDTTAVFWVLNPGD